MKNAALRNFEKIAGKLQRTPFLWNTTGRLVCERTFCVKELLQRSSLDLLSFFLPIKLHCVKSGRIRSYSGRNAEKFGRDNSKYRHFSRRINALQSFTAFYLT